MLRSIQCYKWAYFTTIERRESLIKGKTIRIYDRQWPKTVCEELYRWKGRKNFISFLSYLMSISFVTQFFCFYHYLPILPSTMLYVVASFNCKTGILEKDVDQTYLQHCITNYHEIISQKIWTLRYCISAKFSMIL